MRLLSDHTKQEEANRLANYLNHKGWESIADPTRAGAWQVWVIDESHLTEAQEATAKFLENPTASEFTVKAPTKIKSAPAAPPNRPRPAPSKDSIAGKWSRDDTPLVTGGLFLLSLLVSYPWLVQDDMRIFRQLLAMTSIDYGWMFNSRDLPEVRQGQVWRLITPIFMHFNFFHILFNMSMLFTLGLMTEKRFGHLRTLGLVLILALVSNLAQFFVSGPAFGGMSGVVYGLIGFIWAYYSVKPESDLWLPPSTIAFAMLWFVVCALGAIPNVANWAHGGGLVAGIIAAAIVCRRIPFVKRRRPWKN